jgi:hypothetical protein
VQVEERRLADLNAVRWIAVFSHAFPQFLNCSK